MRRTFAELTHDVARKPWHYVFVMVSAGMFWGAVLAGITNATVRADTPPWTSTLRSAATYNTEAASSGMRALEWAHRNTSPNTFINFARGYQGAFFRGDVEATSLVSPTVALARLSDTETRDTLRLELLCQWEIPLEAASVVSGTIRGVLVGAPYSGEVTWVLEGVVDQEGRCP
jgi:hypothetical protein